MGYSSLTQKRTKIGDTPSVLEEAAKTDCEILRREANRKVIKKEIVKDRTEYFENKFNYKEDSSKAWRTANKLL